MLPGPAECRVWLRAMQRLQDAVAVAACRVLPLLAATMAAAIAVVGCAGVRRAPVEAFGNLGAAVNSAADDYAPALQDTATLVVTSNRVESGRGSLQLLHSQSRGGRLLFSMRLGQAWDVAQPYLLMLDAPDEQWATIAFAPPGSPFGTVAYVCACGRDGSVGGCDLYAITRAGEPAPVNLGPDVNSAGWDGHPCLSPNGSRLYFASDRPGGLGGTDIWYCERMPGGAWSAARNAGGDINTAEDELSPFVEPATGAIYVASHTADAGMDIFVLDAGSHSRRRLTAPYNSPADDITPFVANGTIFLASNRPGGFGGLDVYAFALER